MKMILRSGSVLTVVILMFLTSIFSACSGPSASKAKPVAAAKLDTLEKASARGHDASIISQCTSDTLLDPHTFDTCSVYAAADTTTKIIARLPAMYPLRSLGRYELNGSDTVKPNYVRVWSHVFYKVRLNDKQEGFIRENNIAKYVLNDAARGAQYYIGTYLNKKENKLKLRTGKLVGKTTPKLISYLEVDDVPEADRMFFLLPSNSLKNVDRLIKIISFGEYCGGTLTELLIADVHDKLTALPECYNGSDDGGGVYVKLVYMPTLQKDGNIILKKDTVGHMADDPGPIAYPGQLKIPMTELMVETIKEGEYYMNDNNEQVKLKNGKYRMIRPLTLTTQYYHWDGKNITKLPGKTKVKL